MRKVGICGSDVKYWTHGAIGTRFVVKNPMILGHECSGVVSQVGKNVTHLKEGQHLVLFVYDFILKAFPMVYFVCKFHLPPIVLFLSLSVQQDTKRIFLYPNDYIETKVNLKIPTITK